MATTWLSAREAAKVLGVTENTVRRRASKGVIASRTNAKGVLEFEAPTPAPGSIATGSSVLPPAPGSSSAPGSFAAGSGEGDEKEKVGGGGDPREVTAGDYQKMEADGRDDDVSRFQKLAGASVMLAQKQADEANEKLAIVRFELNRARQQLRWAWGAVSGVAALLFLVLVFGGGPSEVSAAEQGAADAKSNQTLREIRQLKASIEEQTERLRALEREAG